MDGQWFDSMIKALGSGVSRRRALRGLFAGAGGGALILLTQEPSEAGLRRCCRRLKRTVAKPNCFEKGGDNCKVVNWSCEKNASGSCDGGWACRDDTTDNPACF